MQRDRMLKICACVGIGLLSACTQVPKLQEQITDDLKQAAYPDLVPLDQTLAPLPDPTTASSELERELAARRARLRARAQAVNVAAL